MKAIQSCAYPNVSRSGCTVERGCRVHRLIARRACRLGSRQASHLIDEERKRSCTGSVHSSGSFCTKLRLLALRTPPSWLAAGAPGRMPAARRPEMHHASLCAGAYLKGHRDANGWRSRCVGRSSIFCGEKRKENSGPYPPLAKAVPVRPLSADSRSPVLFQIITIVVQRTPGGLYTLALAPTYHIVISSCPSETRCVSTALRVPPRPTAPRAERRGARQATCGLRPTHSTRRAPRAAAVAAAWRAYPETLGPHGSFGCWQGDHLMGALDHPRVGL